MPRTAMWLVGGLIGLVAVVFGTIYLTSPSDKEVTPTEVPLPEKKPKKLLDCPVQPCSDASATPKEEEPPKVIVTPPSTEIEKPPINDDKAEPSFEEQLKIWQEEAR